MNVILYLYANSTESNSSEGMHLMALPKERDLNFLHYINTMQHIIVLFSIYLIYFFSCIQQSIIYHVSRKSSELLLK